MSPTYFSPGQSITANWHPEGRELTIIVWALWEEGIGPLVQTSDEAWAFPYDHDGSCAFRVGSKGQVTAKPVSDVQGRWALYALATEEQGAELWIDDGPVETWNSAPVEPQATHLVLGGEATGAMAHFAVLERRLTHDELRKLWDAAQKDPSFLE